MLLKEPGGRSVPYYGNRHHRQPIFPTSSDKRNDTFGSQVFKECWLLSILQKSSKVQVEPVSGYLSLPLQFWELEFNNRRQ